MQFVELTPDEFRAYADQSPYKSFYQTPEIASLREQNGWVPYYFGVRQKAQAFPSNSNAPDVKNRQNSQNSPDSPSSAGDNNGSLLAATMLVARPAFLGKSVFYAPGGPLIDFENVELLAFFTKHLKQYLKSHNGYVLHIEPYYERLERDRDGLPVVGGFDHQLAEQNLQSLGFIKLPVSDEPQYQFVLPLTEFTNSQPSAPKPQKSQKSQKSPANNPTSKNTSNPTSKNTPDFSVLEEALLASFKRNTRNHIRKAEKMGVTVRELSRAELPRFKAITESTSNRRDFADKPLKYYETMYDLFAPRGEVHFLLAEADGHDLSAAMFMTYGDEVIYLFSGSDEKYMRNYNAQYAIQWHMIKFAAKNGFKKYNFYGISGLPNPSDPDYGIYDFKKGFGGHVVELIGAHDLPISNLYRLHALLSKLRKK